MKIGNIVRSYECSYEGGNKIIKKDGKVLEFEVGSLLKEKGKKITEITKQIGNFILFLVFFVIALENLKAREYVTGSILMTIGYLVLIFFILSMYHFVKFYSIYKIKVKQKDGSSFYMNIFFENIEEEERFKKVLQESNTNSENV